MCTFSKIASFIFAIVGLLHLLRLIFHTEVTIEQFRMPFWLSIIGLVATVVLSIGLWKESKFQK